MQISKSIYFQIGKIDYTAEVVFTVYAEEDIDGKIFYDVDDQYEIESIVEDESLESIDLDSLHPDFYEAIDNWIDKNYTKLIKQAKYEEES